MSREYTTRLISEIDSYICNLKHFLSYDISKLENEYKQYIEAINTNTAKAIIPIIEEYSKKTSRQEEFELLIEEVKKEKDILEMQRISAQAIYDAKKKKISSCRARMKKFNKELEIANEHVKDPLRWVLGYKAKDQEEIKKLQTEIADCERELKSLEQECSNEEIKELNARIKKITTNIEELVKEKGSITDAKSFSKGVLSWLAEEYWVSKLCWLGERGLEESEKREIIPSKEISEFKRIYRKINISSIKGYALMNYKSLLELLALLPNKLYGVGIEKTSPFNSYKGFELDESFSAACQEKFRELCGISPTGTTDVVREWGNTYVSATNMAYTDYTFPCSPIAINSDFVNGIIYITEKNKDPIKQNTNIFDPLLKNVAEVAIAEEQISVSLIQRKFKIGYGRAAKIIEELEKLGIISDSNGSKSHTIINHDLSMINFSNNANASDSILEETVVEKLLVSEEEMECFEKSKSDTSTNLINFTYINESFLIQLKKLIEANSEADLPELVMELRADEIDEYENIAEAFISFRNLYRETPEQIIKTNQEFFAKKEIEQISENARKEREMYERQAALDREAENERARMMAEAESERAEAERERVAAIERQTYSMARQASLDRAAAERRANEAAEHARYEARQKELREQAAARSAHHDEVSRARSRCLQCARRGVCHNKETPNCASFIPK